MKQHDGRDLAVLLLPLDRMLVHLIYTLVEETTWGKVPFLRKQHDGRDQACVSRKSRNVSGPKSYVMCKIFTNKDSIFVDFES